MVVTATGIALWFAALIIARMSYSPFSNLISVFLHRNQLVMQNRPGFVSSRGNYIDKGKAK